MTMDKLTGERLQELDRRLLNIFTEAFETAVRRNETALWKLNNFYKYGKGVPKTPEDFKLWDKLTPAERQAAAWNYLQQSERSEGLLKSITAELQNSRKTASQLIQNELLNTADTSYRWQAENLRGQSGSEQMYFTHNLYNREQLRVLMAGDGITGRPFSKIAFRNYEITGKRAENNMILKLQNQLAQGLALGESIDLIERRIQSEMVYTSVWQARRIARTETLRTANWGRWQAAQQAVNEHGIPVKKEWITTNDERTRDMHAAMSGQRVKYDEDFVLPNGETARFPLDSGLSAENVINCRCIHIYVIDSVASDAGEAYDKLVDKSRDISYTRLYQSAYKENEIFDAHVQSLKDNEMFDLNLQALKDNEIFDARRKILDGTYPDGILQGRQNKHIEGTFEYGQELIRLQNQTLPAKPGVLLEDVDPQELVERYRGTELIEFHPALRTIPEK